MIKSFAFAFTNKLVFAIPVFGIITLAQVFPLPINAAEQLRLRDGVSFTQDLDNGFPIEADNLDDYSVVAGKPTLIFFGASGDLNTNRQAKRFVDLYNKYRTQVQFLVVDVDHLNNPKAKALASEHYKGYIPAEVLLDKTGRTAWTQVGEVETATVADRLEKIIGK